MLLVGMIDWQAISWICYNCWQFNLAFDLVSISSIESIVQSIWLQFFKLFHINNVLLDFSLINVFRQRLAKLLLPSVIPKIVDQIVLATKTMINTFAVSNCKILRFLIVINILFLHFLFNYNSVLTDIIYKSDCNRGLY